MNMPINYSQINEAKADFTDLYTSKDPRNYFKYLGQLDYIIPHLAQPIFNQLIRARQETQAEPVTVLDIGCSYAINGALLKYAVDFEALRQRYTAPPLQGQTSAQMLELDKHFYQGWPKNEGVRVIGLDVSDNAVRYAQGCGTLDHGMAVDLESRDPSPQEAKILSEVDIIISTGCVGYVSAKTFERVAKLTRRGRAPWAANFVLRMFPFDHIAATLEKHGLTTEPYEGASFVQRRFASRKEMEGVIEAVEARGIDTDGHETEGVYHSNLFVSRPPEEIERRPLRELVSVVSGANKFWNVGANVLGSYGQAVRKNARAAQRLSA